MADKVYNRYVNRSDKVEIFLTEEGTVRMMPGGTAVAEAGSTVAKSRHTFIIERNVELPDYSAQAEENYEEQAEETPQVPQHENTNPTNTRPGEGATILTDDFDGSGGTGAVNTSAALTSAVESPETPKPEADTSPKVTEDEADAKKSGSKTRGK